MKTYWGNIKNKRPEATKREPRAWGYNWATLFLGDINTGIWNSRLGESRMRQRHMVSNETVKCAHEF
jgi:hypothetical protein